MKMVLFKILGISLSEELKIFYYLIIENLYQSNNIKDIKMTNNYAQAQLMKKSMI